MIFLTWYLYSLEENMKKLTEATDGKELSGVVIIKKLIAQLYLGQKTHPSVGY